jgi:hypothetical protein
MKRVNKCNEEYKGNRTSKKGIIGEKTDRTNCNKSKLKLASGLLLTRFSGIDERSAAKL